jgi:ABC-type antimicrobial peptide transport system ATPase subunit
VEANVVGVLTEALTANVEVILADQAGLMGADSAIRSEVIVSLQLLTQQCHIISYCRGKGRREVR